METLENIIIKQCSLPIKFKSIPTQSSHSKLIKQYINEIAFNHPEYQNILVSIVCLPIQKWAQEQRKKINIKELNSAINNSAHEDELNKTDEMIKFIENALTKEEKGKDTKVLKAAHIISEPDETTFRIVSHYKDSLLFVCEKYYKQLDKIIKRNSKEYNQYDDETQLLYHDIEILIRSKQSLQKIEVSTNKKIKNIDCTKLQNNMEILINTLKTYINNGEDIYRVIEAKYNGKTEVQIVDELNKSRVYIRARYAEGIAALSYILWGYTTKNILNSYR